MTSRFTFAFKYKLVVLIASMILVLLGGSFFVVQRNIEIQFTQSIQQQLYKTEQLISELMDNRARELNSYAIALQGQQLIRSMLQDKSMDRITRDDILDTEVLPDFPVLSHLIIADAEGKLLAANRNSSTLLPAFIQAGLLETVSNGDKTSHYLFDQQHCVQLMGTPIFLQEEMIGLLFVGITLTPDWIARTQAMTGADLALFNGPQIFLASDWHRPDEARAPLLQQIERLLQQTPARWQSQKFGAMELMGERYLSITVANPGFVPPYLLAVSLDQALSFVQKIRSHMAWVGSIGLFLGLVVAFGFALGISKPIESLRYATTEVERENFDYRVNIKTQDEFSLLGQSFNHMLSELADKERIRGVMNKVVSKEIADELLRDDIQLGGEERIATVLCTDIRGFTTLAEGLPPNRLLSLLNDYFTRQSFCIDAHQGVIDKYIGDALMALFGVPIAREQDAYHAVLAALDIIEALALFNLEMALPLQKTINIGIAVNTGHLIAGNVGAENRLNYTVLGDAVNTAFRLEGLTKRYGVQIIISAGTYQAIAPLLTANPPPFQVRLLDCVQVKGKTQGIDIYQVFSRQDSTDLEQLAQWITAYQQARQQLQATHFQQALDQFAHLNQHWPQDVPTQVMLQRCQRYAAQPEQYAIDYPNGAYLYFEK